MTIIMLNIMLEKMNLRKLLTKAKVQLMGKHNHGNKTLPLKNNEL